MGDISVKRSYRDGCVKVAVKMKASGFREDSVTVGGSCDISTDDARALATALIAEADRVDAKVVKEKASAERRAKWREREMAAGRMVSMSPAEFLKRV